MTNHEFRRLVRQAETEWLARVNQDQVESDLPHWDRAQFAIVRGELFKRAAVTSLL